MFSQHRGYSGAVISLPDQDRNILVAGVPGTGSGNCLQHLGEFHVLIAEDSLDVAGCGVLGLHRLLEAGIFAFRKEAVDFADV